MTEDEKKLKKKNMIGMKIEEIYPSIHFFRRDGLIPEEKSPEVRVDLLFR